MYRRSLAVTLRGLVALAHNRAARAPLNVTLELTRRCNARCDYCHHWKEQRASELTLADCVRVVERFRPFSATVCGGEPFLRRDVLDVVRALKHAPGWRYLSIITNGWFLDDDKAARLHATGIDQINVSCNYPDARQDDDRKLPGLFGRIARAVPRLAHMGANVQLNAILMNDNLDDAVGLARRAREWGARITYTLYSELPADNVAHLFPPSRRARLAEVLAELKTQPNVSNTPWYFDTIPSYVAGTPILDCSAGKGTLHVSPTGQVRPCAELPPVGHFTTYDPRRAAPVTCTRCFQACRGEVEAPITLHRVAAALTS